jgi:hypothetical protein
MFVQTRFQSYMYVRTGFFQTADRGLFGPTAMPKGEIRTPSFDCFAPIRNSQHAVARCTYEYTLPCGPRSIRIDREILHPSLWYMPLSIGCIYLQRCAVWAELMKVSFSSGFTQHQSMPSKASVWKHAVSASSGVNVLNTLCIIVSLVRATR